MANINKIRVSGTTYNIQDINAPKTVELTQAQYDALVDKDPNTFYVITDAQAGDLTNYYTKSETNTLLGDKADTATTYTKTEVDNAITAATSTKQDTLVSSQNIKTINNESILGSGNIDIQGGGKAVAAGTNISITTSETADTINCTVPYVGSPNYTITYGYGVTNNSQHSLVIGAYCNTTNSTQNNIVVGYDCHSREGHNAAFGLGNYSNNRGELSSGYYNVSNSGSTDADKTLFSVGNGTANNARHNAFEVRKNGDIYCSDGTNDVKLQDTITATAANTTALGGLKLVKLTQAEYDALATKDSSTLYIVTDS